MLSELAEIMAAAALRLTVAVGSVPSCSERSHGVETFCQGSCDLCIIEFTEIGWLQRLIEHFGYFALLSHSVTCSWTATSLRLHPLDGRKIVELGLLGLTSQSLGPIGRLVTFGAPCSFDWNGFGSAWRNLSIFRSGWRWPPVYPWSSAQPMASVGSWLNCCWVLPSMAKRLRLVYWWFMIISFDIVGALLVHSFAWCPWPTQSRWSCWVGCWELGGHVEHLRWSWRSSASSGVRSTAVLRYHHFLVISGLCGLNGRETLVGLAVAVSGNPWSAKCLEAKSRWKLYLRFLLPQTWRSSLISSLLDCHHHYFDSIMMHLLCKMDNSSDSKRIGEVLGLVGPLRNSCAPAACFGIGACTLATLNFQ